MSPSGPRTQRLPLLRARLASGRDLAHGRPVRERARRQLMSPRVRRRVLVGRATHYGVREYGRVEGHAAHVYK